MRVWNAPPDTWILSEGNFDPLSVALFAVTESERRAAASFGIEPDDPRPGVGLRELHGHFGRNDVQHPLFGEVVVFDFYRPERFERSQFFGRGGHGRDVFRGRVESGDPDVLHVGSGRDVRAAIRLSVDSAAPICDSTVKKRSIGWSARSVQS